MSEQRITSLKAIGFSFDPHADAWNGMLEELKTYKKNHGYCNVPHKSTKLYIWVYAQRVEYKNKKLSEERFKTLEAMGFLR